VAVAMAVPSVCDVPLAYGGKVNPSVRMTAGWSNMGQVAGISKAANYCGEGIANQ
jgi:hypothetical protein